MDELKQKKSKIVFQFKITLREIKPVIWRRIQVPATYSFWDLHVAIQGAMGWTDSHLHEFKIINPEDGKLHTMTIFLDGEPYCDDLCFDDDKKIYDYFSEKNKEAFYLYDFGDGWEHDIVLEQILPKITGEKYPKIINGERACPPEDCGSTPGYENFVAIMKNKRHPEYKEMLEWHGKKYDAADWRPAYVRFDSPRVRYKEVFETDVEFA